jgi:hypothetical protein
MQAPFGLALTIEVTWSFPTPPTTGSLLPQGLRKRLSMVRTPKK